MEIYCLWLVLLFHAANPVLRAVLDRYGNAEEAYRAITGGDLALLDETQKAALPRITLDKAREIAAYCEKREYGLLSLTNERYPSLLKEIYNPPLLLFYRGKPECLDEGLAITAVGSREITPYIKKLCGRVCTDLAERGAILVSGLARGVDTAVHQACINAGRPTVGVLACGINYDYPRGSAELRQRIVQSGGAIFSELIPGTPPSPDYFHARNRILAGLSRGTAVFQAGAESGALITASYAVDEGRDVFCVPPPDIFDPRYSGVVKFLREGATPIFNHDDILNEYPEYD
ncbi:MAG: DNA-processing protein DprA [Bacteroides sp.]|nr:DNA-processing protein DprA [Eubacterium sp.]MCM1417428.1 DNA-processing protein DprA [Roseburia sp.]MCM1461607.1 DNA-processing protein DprA [Bacteroides sp.]